MLARVNRLNKGLPVGNVDGKCLGRLPDGPLRKLRVDRDHSIPGLNVVSDYVAENLLQGAVDQLAACHPIIGLWHFLWARQGGFDGLQAPIALLGARERIASAFGVERIDIPQL